MSGAARQLVTLGRISGLFGVKGWVKVFSYMDPRDGIVAFETWILRRDGDEKICKLEQGRNQGRTVVAKLLGVDDRDEANEFVGAEIAVERSALTPCDPGEYYWTDLEGMEVVTTAGQTLGRLDHLFETGGHDVMVVEGDRQRLIPFVQDKVVQDVQLDQRLIVVDWDPTY
ncbi:MAG: ribosome maturation factor RimM [Candidatus Rariloculaceae bacterium]